MKLSAFLYIYEALNDSVIGIIQDIGIVEVRPRSSFVRIEVSFFNFDYTILYSDEHDKIKNKHCFVSIIQSSRTYI